jgi:beta-lactamase superfamily II metal-dependent hydrolase
MTVDCPKDSELEISIFGPGYGEAIAVHLGSGKWILVDSCLEPISGTPAHFHYLKNLGIDPCQAVKLIVATHWHDDHIQGLSDTMRQCDSARIAISGALQSEYFAALLDRYMPGTFPGSSGVTEFVKVFQNLEERKRRGNNFYIAKPAAPDQLLLRETININGNNYDAEVYSLSPSDLAIIKSHMEFFNIIPVTGGQRKRVIPPSINNTSIVLWIKVGKRVILLGADLERSNNPKLGWAAIINDSQITIGKAEIYKVAHHGAESSHEPVIWTKLLSDNPYALISPYMVGNNRLPKDTDMERIAGLTPYAYITALPSERSFRTSEKVVRDTVKSVTKSMHSLNTHWGQVRLRGDIENEANYEVELFGDAYKIENR